MSVSQSSATTISVHSVTSGGVHLIVQYFRVHAAPPTFVGDKVRQRQDEYDFCLLHHARHPHIASIHVLLESDDDDALLREITALHLDAAAAAKVVPVHHGKRMRYADAFRYANTVLAGRVVAVTNADIFVTRGIEALLQSRLLAEGNRVLAMTRHEPRSCSLAARSLGSSATSGDPAEPTVSGPCGCPLLPMPPRNIISHDQFWFVSPVPEAVVRDTDHPQNRWGAEHVVINAFLRAGYTVLNPARTLRIYHKHASDVRPWLRAETNGGQVLARPGDHASVRACTLREACTDPSVAVVGPVKAGGGGGSSTAAQKPRATAAPILPPAVLSLRPRPRVVSVPVVRVATPNAPVAALPDRKSVV